MSSRRLASSLRDSRFSRASLVRADVLESLRSGRDFCRLGFLFAAVSDTAPCSRSMQIKNSEIGSLRIELQFFLSV